MKAAIPCLILLTACSPQPPADPDAHGTIVVQITGADGAAFGQIGQVVLGPDGNMTCTMTYPPVTFASEPALTTQREFSAPRLYSILANYIRANDSPGPATSFEDIIKLNDPADPVAILPISGIFGLTDARAGDVVALINNATNGECLIYG
ncbi:hypothetical protein SAMN04488515_2691 [Cognatiyoonia koreensis]|uniref:Uncharacterized protein n=1 Tax=Cognatiyoonia koreensis TaxID=364200 RepID=A0A1I0RHH2_9RHOB|nr:hypothetical protein [Cognatiyoonia koreensis]SEW40277.1 hypothetical protein SAMN04488515_2691 [Cognatiyoonia koreensis]